MLAFLLYILKFNLTMRAIRRYVPSTVFSLKIARYFGKHTDDIFQLDEND